ncbi:MAG: hypothetical protein ACRCWR_00920 [Saezia sp.]
MKTPIPLPVKKITVSHMSSSGDWQAEITFGIPNHESHDDPTITLKSGEGIKDLPKVGDIMLVRPPEVLGWLG